MGGKWTGDLPPAEDLPLLMVFLEEPLVGLDNTVVLASELTSLKLRC